MTRTAPDPRSQIPAPPDPRSQILAPITVADLGERELIRRIQARTPAPPGWVSVAIGDDAAIVEPERNAAEVVTTDALIEGVHFERAFSGAADVGYKALAVNLSDLAAMGATPRFALLSLALPAALAVEAFDALVDGFMEIGAAHRVTLVGGNVTRTPGPLAIDVTASGSVKRRRAILRAAARPGDELFVSGTIGAAAAGLDWCRASIADPAGPVNVETEWPRSRTGNASAGDMRACVDRYLRPEPRVRLGSLVGRNRAASAGIDLSDGLAAAVRQLMEASGTGAVIDADAVPVDEAARRWFRSRGADPVLEALGGGDDYELLVSVPRKLTRRLAAVGRLARTPLTRIGEVTAARDLVLRRHGRDEPLPEGYEHF